MKELKIGINGSMLDDQPTGVGVYTYNLANNLFQLFQTEKRNKLEIFSPTRSHLNKNIPVIKLPNLLQSSRFGKTAAICRFLWNTFSYPISARKFDLLISPTTHGSFILKNQIITIHDLISLRYSNISLHQRLYFKYLLPYLIAKARMVIAVSESTKKEIIQYLKCPEEKIQVIYNGYDSSSFFIKEEYRQLISEIYGVNNYFLAVGPTYPHKNFEFLLETYCQLNESTKKQFPLVIAGGMKHYVQKLEILVSKLRLNDYVHFLGYVPKEFMPSLYREAYALVFPSLYEGFGFPLVEAMACGCPVLASATSSMPEVCGDAASYFDPLKKESLLAAIEDIVYNPSMRAEMIERGIIQSKQFNWSNTAQSLFRIIDKQFQKT